MNQLVHSIFVIKYWTIALKTKSILTKQNDEWLQYKVWPVAIFQISLMVSIEISGWFIPTNEVKWVQILINVYYTSPVLVILVLLISSFLVLQKTDSYTLSKEQVALQTFAYTIFAFAYWGFWFKPNFVTYDIYLVLDWLSLLILSMTLMHIAEL